MARTLGTKSTVEIGVGELLAVLAPFKGTPLKVSLGTGWVNSVAVLGITFNGNTLAAPDGDGEERAEPRPTFAVEGA